MTVSSAHLRQSFLNFFKRHHHFIETSAPLIPHDDPSLLFVNAGMVQFKNVFTQAEKRAYTRAATSQKCVRAGGKHNDLENVGQTARHHTFFEMLGNFSFGDYFKEDAIKFAWQFLTEELKLDPERLSVSVFKGDAQVPADTEAITIWRDVIGLAPHKIKQLGREDNFWQMGDTGPCGPCSEIHYDRSGLQEGFGLSLAEDKDIEIWNLVFMQYEMQLDGKLKPLPAPCVDTGMGLERLACVINGYGSNYDTDLLRPLIKKAEELSHKTYQASNSVDDTALRVIADHARACAFLIADGLFPSNEGRGYVLRRFMRRAIRHGSVLGLNELFFHEVCAMVATIMGNTYPELIEALPLMEKVVRREEESFRRTLDRGLQLFTSQTKDLPKDALLDGEIVFRLYETFGFPVDLTEDLAKERGIAIDWSGFSVAQKAHEVRSASSLGLKGIDDLYLRLADRLAKTEFTDTHEATGLNVVALIKDGVEVDQLEIGEHGFLVADRSPFYAESGGQMGDTGTLSGATLKATVSDTKKALGFHLHVINVEKGSVSVGDTIDGCIDHNRRAAIMRNHSATHLLHSALRQVLGDHVVQKGSLVAPDRLRFDFAHFEALTAAQLSEIEDIVNQWIVDNEEAHVAVMNMDEAKAAGALALFGEKYEAKVRVLSMGSHSTELCGGTHCHRTGDIGSLRIVSEGPLAQGIRRIEAITADAVIKHGRSTDRIIKDACLLLQVKPQDLAERIEQLLGELKKFQAAQKSHQLGSLKDRAEHAASKAITVHGIRVVTELVDFIDDPSQLRVYADLIRDRINSGLVALGLLHDDRCSILVALTKDLSSRLHAGNIISSVAPIIGGKGGGRPDFAQAGGTNQRNINEALQKIVALIV